MVVLGGVQDAWFTSVNHLSRETPWLHAPARVYAEDGIVLFAVLLLGSWLLARRTGDLARVGRALWAPVGALVALGLNQLLVHGIGQSRPYAVLPHVLVLVHRSTDPSFPSDHSVVAGAVAAGVLLVHRRLGLLTLALAVLMAADRVYVGAHFPLDVVVGLVVGAVLQVASYAVVRPVLLRLLAALARTPLAPLVAARHA